MSGAPIPPESQPETGSPEQGESVFLAVGKLRRSHGVRGDILMEIFTDFPERLKPGGSLFAGDTHQPLRLTRVRKNNDLLIVRFGGYTTPEQVNELTNLVVYVKAEDIPPLPEGEYYHHQLIGLEVSTDGDETLGKVSEIIETGANDVLAVKNPSGKEILLPWNDDVIRKIDLEQGRITVHLLPGLIED